MHNSRVQAKNAQTALWSLQIFTVRSQRSCWNEKCHCSLRSVCLPACLSLFSPDVRGTSQQLRQEMSPQAVKRADTLQHRGERPHQNMHTHTHKHTHTHTQRRTQKTASGWWKLCGGWCKKFTCPFFLREKSNSLCVCVFVSKWASPLTCCCTFIYGYAL